MKGAGAQKANILRERLQWEVVKEIIGIKQENIPSEAPKGVRT